MQHIKIEAKNERIYLYTPFCEAMPLKAKNLGGKWIDGAWVFAAQDLELVRAMCQSIWGADDTDEGAEAVRLRCTRFKKADKGALTLFGVQLARAFGRDSSAKLGEDIVVLRGEFAGGGSMKNWYTQVDVGTVFEMRNLPHGTAQRIREWCRADNEKAHFVVEASGDTAARLAALQAERDRLALRLREVEAEIGALQ